MSFGVQGRTTPGQPLGFVQYCIVCEPEPVWQQTLPPPKALQSAAFLHSRKSPVFGQSAVRRHSHGAVHPGVAQQTAIPCACVQFESFTQSAPIGCPVAALPPRPLGAVPPLPEDRPPALIDPPFDVAPPLSVPPLPEARPPAEILPPSLLVAPAFPPAGPPSFAPVPVTRRPPVPPVSVLLSSLQPSIAATPTITDKTRMNPAQRPTVQRIIVSGGGRRRFYDVPCTSENASSVRHDLGLRCRTYRSDGRN